MAKLKTFEKEITVKLTEAEIEQRRLRIVDALGELEAKESEKRAELGDLNGAIKAYKEELKKLRIAATTGQETRTVECFEERDEQRGHILTIRVDTNETIDERAMTAEERQADLFADGGETSESGDETNAAADETKVARVPPGKRAPKGRKASKREARS